MPTADQSAALAALRKELAKLDSKDPKNSWAIHASDQQCLKFLIGHKLKVDEAAKLMIRCSAWRYEYRTGDLIAKMESKTAPMEVRFAKAYLPMGVIGVDSDGRPVMLNRMSAMDFPRLIGDFGLDRAVEYSIYVQEKLLENNPNGECVVIIDLGIEDQANPPFATLLEVRAWIAALLKFLQPFAGLVDPFYPEMFNKIFFTRAPAMFAATWSIAKNFVAEATREKIEILGNKNATKRLLEVLPKEVVPIFLGGINELPGLGKGGKLPKGASSDITYIEQLEKELRDVPVVSQKGPAEESEVENPLQRRAALDVLRAAIHVEISKMESSSERGSWQFIPGKEFLETLEDDELERTLKEYNYDHVQSFQALYRLALQKERIQLPVEKEKQPSSEGEDSLGKSKSKGSWLSSFLKPN